MLAAFEQATLALPPARIHVERFGASPAAAAAGGFKVVLARSDLQIAVPPGQTILQAVLDAGIDAPHSCMAGVCGSCETRVIRGMPDHRDFVLQPDQRASNATMMICISGCKSDTLVLDL
jgi:vanillate O-demethylase ferredoxin subunit